MRSDSKAQAREYKNLCLDVFFLPFRFQWIESKRSRIFLFFLTRMKRRYALFLFAPFGRVRSEVKRKVGKEGEFAIKLSPLSSRSFGRAGKAFFAKKSASPSAYGQKKRAEPKGRACTRQRLRESGEFKAGQARKPCHDVG